MERWMTLAHVRIFGFSALIPLLSNVCDCSHYIKLIRVSRIFVSCLISSKILRRAPPSRCHTWKWLQATTRSGATIVLNGGWCVVMDLLSVPGPPQRAPSHPAGSLRNPHIELIITSQPLPSLITHILKLVEQSIPALDADCGGRTVASAFKSTSIFCVCAKEISTPARRLRSTGPRPVSRSAA